MGSNRTLHSTFAAAFQLEAQEMYYGRLGPDGATA